MSDRPDVARDLIEALQWILKVADLNYEQDDKLRSDSARTLKRIAERAETALSRALGLNGQE